MNAKKCNAERNATFPKLQKGENIIKGVQIDTNNIQIIKTRPKEETSTKITVAADMFDHFVLSITNNVNNKIKTETQNEIKGNNLLESAKISIEKIDKKSIPETSSYTNIKQENIDNKITVPNNSNEFIKKEHALEKSIEKENLEHKETLEEMGNKIKTYLQLNNGIIIRGKSGKTFTLKPRNPPIVFKPDNFLFLTEKTLPNLEQSLESSGKVKTVEMTTNNITTPNPTKLNINDKKCVTLNSKLLQSCKPYNIIKSKNNKPELINSEAQTENKNFVDRGVQTEKRLDLFADLENDVPLLADLVEYLLENPKYSNDIDQTKKSTLLDMSKNITFKNKVTSAPVKSMTSQRDIKVKLFFDLRDCMIYDNTGNMIIHNAILDNDIKLMMRQIHVLKLRNVSVNIENINGMLPIQMAVINNSDIKIIETLLQNYALVTVKDCDGNNLIHLIIMHSTPKVLETVLGYSKNCNILDDTNDEGLTPLMMATIEKKNKFVEMLLNEGTNPNIRDEKSGRTALFHAVENDSEDIINLLLKYKADPKINNYLGVCPLEAAKDILGCRKDPFNIENYQNVLVKVESKTNTEKCKIDMVRKRHRKPKNEAAKKVKISFVPSLRKISDKQKSKSK